MSHGPFVGISLLILLCSFMMFRRVVGSFDLKKINMISWLFYYSLLGQSFVASIFVVIGLDEHYAISRVGDDSRLYGWLAVQYTMVALPLGMILGQMIFGYKSNKKIFNKYIYLPIDASMSNKDSYLKLCLYCLSFVSVTAVAYTLALMPTNPLLAAFSGFDALALAGLRQQAAREFTGNIYFRNIFAIGITPILTYISYAYWKKSQSQFDALWFLLMFTTTFFILTYDLSKSPFVMFLLGFLFLNVLINGGVTKKVFIYFILFAFALVVGAYYLVMDMVDFGELLSFRAGIGGRILFSQAAGTYFAFEYFPRTENFIGLSSLSSVLSGVVGGDESERMARILMTIFNPSAVADGLAGVMNSLFIAEAWANFGLLGVVFAPLYVGFVVQVMFMYFITTNKTPIKLGLLAHFSLAIPITGGFNDFLYNPGIFIITIVFGFAMTVAYLLKTGSFVK